MKWKSETRQVTFIFYSQEIPHRADGSWAVMELEYDILNICLVILNILNARKLKKTAEIRRSLSHLPPLFSEEGYKRISWPTLLKICPKTDSTKILCYTWRPERYWTNRFHWFFSPLFYDRQIMTPPLFNIHPSIQLTTPYQTKECR